MADTNRTANITFKISGADNSRHDVKKVRDEFEQFGDEAKKSAQRASDALGSVQKAADKVEKTISQGRAVNQRDLNTLVLAYKEFDAAVVAAWGDAAKAPAETQKSLTLARKQVEEVTSKVREQKDALGEHNQELSEGGERWGGLGEAMNKALGPAGKIQAQMALVGAAFGEGWSIGMKLNQLFGTDMSLWEEAVARFGSKLGAIVRAVSDNIVGVVNVVKALLSGNLGEIKTAVGELRDNVINSGKVMSDVVTKWGAEWDAVHPSIKQTEEKLRAAAEATRKLAEEKERLREKINAVVKSIQDETAELQKQKGIAEDASLRVVDRADQLSYYERKLRDATNAVTAQRDEVERLTKAHGAQDPATRAASEALSGLEASLKYTKTSYDETSAQVKNYESVQRSAESAIKSSHEKLGSLYEKQNELTTGTKGLSDAQSSVVTTATATATAIESVGSAAGKAAAEVSNVGKSINDIKALIAVIKELNQVISETTNNASLAAAAIYGMSKAGLDDDGSGGGGEGPA